MTNVLVVSPHSDDAELGMGGTIAKFISTGHKVHVLVMITKDEHLYNNGGLVHADTRAKEFILSMRILGVLNYSIMYEGVDNNFDLSTYNKSETVSNLDEYLIKHSIDWFYMPVPSFHQEHQYCYSCCVAASRPTHSKVRLSKVFGYEYPGAVWGDRSSNDIFGGRYYYSLDGQYIEIKLKALAEHKSQHLSKDGLVSLNSVKTLAEMRGHECGSKYAEMVYSMRGVE